LVAAVIAARAKAGAVPITEPKRRRSTAARPSS
jgi:hypothetical protein